MRRQTSVNMQVLSVSPTDRPSVLIKQEKDFLHILFASSSYDAILPIRES
jgi:hypothetical protein